MGPYSQEDKNTVVDVVLQYPRLKERLELNHKDKDKVLKYIDEIHGKYNLKVIKGIRSFLDNTFGHLYEGITHKVPEGFDLKKLMEEKHVILVPNHQSHADYIAISYLLHVNFNAPVRIAAGINMNIFPVGHFFRNAGAFFMRRSFSNNILYKTTFEGYVYYLLSTGKMVEFFFEGGRSRSGKLLSPRFGLYNILLDVYQQLPVDNRKEMIFVPVTIAHELVPEVRSHANELEGNKKVKESPAQLLKLFKLFTKKFGTIHVVFGKPIVAESQFNDRRLISQDLAFKCFREVGRNMPITPTALLSLILLDEARGFQSWDKIIAKAEKIMAFCQKFNIPYTPTLEFSKLEKTMKEAMDVLSSNKKVLKMRQGPVQGVFYSVKENCRTEVLYFKNTILHHFLVPAQINLAWLKVFNGDITTVASLVQYLNTMRRELRYEFYLPTVKQLLAQALEIVNSAIDIKVKNLSDCLSLSSQDLYKTAMMVSPFADSFTFIYERYYLVTLSIRSLANESFSKEHFIEVAKETFKDEIDRGDTIRYAECFAVPALKVALKYFCHIQVIKINRDGNYFLNDINKLNKAMNHFKEYLHNESATRKITAS